MNPPYENMYGCMKIVENVLDSGTWSSCSGSVRIKGMWSILSRRLRILEGHENQDMPMLFLLKIKPIIVLKQKILQKTMMSYLIMIKSRALVVTEGGM